jgi:hypothetical protein
MAGVSKIVSKTSSAISQKTEAEMAENLAKERAQKTRKQKNTPLGGQKPSETYKKFGFFGYFFLGIEAFIIISLFALKDIVDIIDTATIAAFGIGEAAGEAISTILGLVLGAIVFGWLWFRFGRSKKGSEAAKKAALQGVKILGSFVGSWIADIIPIIEKIPWLTLYGLCLYGMEFYKMATQPESTPANQEEEGPPSPSQQQSSLRAQLQQKTQSDI